MVQQRKNSRNAAGAGSIRQRADGRWEGRFVVNGQRKSVFGHTQDECRKKLTAALSARDNGTYADPVKITLAQWLDTWEAEYLGDVKPRTKTLYQDTTRRYLRPALGKVKLAALKTPQIQSLYNRLTSEGKSPKTVKNVHGILHRALNDAVAVGYLRFNPADAAKLPKTEKPDLHPFSEEQITAFLKAIQGHVYERVYIVTLFCGLRQGEVLGLTWDCVDFKTGTLTINKQLQLARDGSKVTTLTTPKNGKGRVIKPAPSVMQVLQEEKLRQTENQLKAGRLWKNEWDLVFTNEMGQHLAGSSVYSQFKRVAEQIGAPEARFHDLRHSYAVLAIKGGDDILTVQRNLGHHAASFTLDVYGYITDQMKTESAHRMEAQIAQLKQA